MARAQTTFNLTQAAEQIGVSAITLKRWLLSGKVDEVARDRNDWRVFTAVDMKQIKRYASARREPRRT